MLNSPLPWAKSNIHMHRSQLHLWGNGALNEQLLATSKKMRWNGEGWEAERASRSGLLPAAWCYPRGPLNRPNLGKEQTSRSKKHRTPNKMSSQRPTPRHTVFKMTKVEKLCSDALAYLQDYLRSGPLVRCLESLASQQRDWEGTMGQPHTLLASLLRLLQPSWFFLQAPEVPTQLQAPSPNHPAHTACAEVASTPDHFLYEKQSRNCKEKTGEMRKLSRNCENCGRCMWARGLCLPPPP